MNKQNRLSGSWKRGVGVALAAVALVAVLALGGGLVTTPPTAEAQTSLNTSTPWSPPSPLQKLSAGRTVPIQANVTWPNNPPSNYYLKFTIENTSAQATFVANGTTTLICRDAAPGRVSACDTNKTAGQIRFNVKIADNSPSGPIVLRAGLITGNPFAQTFLMTVENQFRPANVTISPTSASINATGGSQAFTIKVTNAAGTALSGEDLRVSTTLGTIQCWDNTGNARTAATQYCGGFEDRTSDATSSNQRNRAALGTQIYTLTAQGTAGVATITVELINTRAFGPVVTASATVVLAGRATKLSLAPEQGTLAIGGSTLVVATVTDGAGNPIQGHRLGNDAGEIAVKAPTGGAPVVATATTDKIVVPATGNLPACNDSTSTTPTLPAGTNAKGQCVIRVAALLGATNPAVRAGRGAHTLTVKLRAGAPASETTTTTIMVGGPPKTINTDAPARVAPLSTTTVNITVLDDAGVRVGGVPLAIDKIEGSGAIRTPTPTTTTDGRAAFTYVASSGGSAVFLIRAGTGAARISETIEVGIGDPAPAKTWSGSVVAGWNNLTWEGADGASVADSIGAGVTAVYRWNQAAQRWDAYFPSATGVPGANDFTTLSQGASYWIFSR